MTAVQMKRLALVVSGVLGAGVGLAYAQTVVPAAPASASTQPTPPAVELAKKKTTKKATTKKRPETLQAITVTGTLISGVAPVGTPVISIDRQQIVDSGVVRTQDLFSSMPAITSNFNQVQSVGGILSGITMVRPNIHNIGASGANTTLVLVNGHDVVGAGLLQSTPDIGILPPAALQRVDVVTDGGSALYGADAVGGIINLVTRTAMEGFQFDAHHGWADEYDTSDANFSFGHEWSTGSYMVSYSYRHNSDLLGADRPYFRTNLVPFGGSDFRSNSCLLSNVSVGGVSYAMPSLVAGTQNLCDEALNSDIFPSETQNSVYGAFSQDLSDSVTFNLTSYWTDRTTVTLGPQVTSSGTITDTNPYFIPIDGAAPELVNYSYASAAGPTLKATTGIHEFGITPELDFDLGKSWSLQTLVYFGHSDTTAYTPELNPAADAAALAGTTTATALDPYLVSQTNGQVISDILDYDQLGRNKQTMVEAKAVAQGELLSLPGGSVHAAVGAQYEYQGSSAVLQTGPNSDFTGATRASVGIKSGSVFGELMIPIVGSDNRVPGVRSFVVDLQGRYDHYNVFGSTTNPKVSFQWQIVRGLTLRGSWGTSFVAPSAADLAGSIDTRLQVVPISPFGPGPFNLRPTLILAGGGPLQPMTSRTYTTGIDLAPVWLPSMTVSLTYWNTVVDHLIGVLPFTSGSYYFDTFPNDFIVNPSLAQVKQIIGNEPVNGPSLTSLYSNPATTPYVFMSAVRTNLGNLNLDGLDLDWRFDQPTSFGSIMASASATYILNQDQQALGVAKSSSMLVAGNNISRLLATASVGVRYERLTSSVRINYSQGFTVDVPNQTHVGSFHPVDLSFAYALPPFQGLKHMALTVNVNNITNEHPAFYNQASVADGVTFISGNGSTLGRFFELGIHVQY